MKFLKNEEGMTRVRVTIVIVVIMILVAFAFSLLIGEDGISFKTKSNTSNVNSSVSNKIKNESPNNEIINKQ